MLENFIFVVVVVVWDLMDFDFMKERSRGFFSHFF